MHRDPNLTDVKTNAHLMARRRAALPAGLGQTYEVFVERADNAELWDVEGKRYIDFAGGIAVLSLYDPAIDPQKAAALAIQLGLRRPLR